MNRQNDRAGWRSRGPLQLAVAASIGAALTAAILIRVVCLPPWTPRLPSPIAEDSDRSNRDGADGAIVLMQRYDDAAAVFVDVGPDGAPGLAGIDDANNGVVDDVDETGATGSDDVLLILPGEQPPPSDTAWRIATGGWLTISQRPAATSDLHALGPPDLESDRRSVLVSAGGERLLP